MEQKVQRNRKFDLLRLFFAVCVLSSHSFEITDGNRSRELLTRLTHGHLSFGEFGVHGFFLLSGYLITQSWLHDPRPLDYLQRRILRIVPGYLVAAMLSILAVGTLAPAVPHFFHRPGLKALSSVLLLGAPATSAVLPGSPYPQVNGPLYTIAYEFRCYLLLAAAGIAGLLGRRGLVLLLTAALLVIGHSEPLLNHLWKAHAIFFGDPTLLFPLTALFALGACYFLYRDRIPYHPGLFWIAVAALAAILIAAPAYTELAVSLCGSYIMFYLAQLPIPALDRLRLPDVSYGTYLYGWPVQSLWFYFMHGSPWINFAVSTVVCLALGYLSWHGLERPMLRLKLRPSTNLAPA